MTSHYTNAKFLAKAKVRVWFKIGYIAQVWRVFTEALRLQKGCQVRLS